MGAKFRNFPIRLKLAISHSLLGALALVVAVVAILAIKNQTNHAEQIYTESAYAKQIVEIRYALTDLEKALALSMLHEEGNTDLQNAMETNAASAIEGAMVLQASLQGTSGEAMISDFIAKLNEAESLRIQMMNSLQAGNVYMAHETYEDSYAALLEELQATTQELYAAAESFSTGYYEDTMREGKISVYLVIVLSILCLFRGYLIVRDISNAADEVTSGSEQIASGSQVLASGAAGKGFAVVADEVRNLASKSAEASQNTSELIGETVAAVAKGSRIATETATSLVEVVEGTKSVTGLVEQIANAANAQAEALTQLNVGITQISSVVDTTSATAEESASAGEELSGQAEVLRNLIHQFRLS